MSDRQSLAEHSTELCVAGLALAGIAAPIALPITSVAILAAMAVDMRGKCDHRRMKRAIDAALKSLGDSPDFTPDDLRTARDLLNDNRGDLRINHARLAEAHAAGDLPAAMLTLVVDATQIPKDGSAARALHIAMTAAYGVLRLEDDYHRIFTQDVLTELAQGSRLMLRKQDETNILIREMKAQIAELLARSESDDGAALADLRDIAAELSMDKPHRADWASLVTYILEKVQDQAAAIARIETADAGDLGLDNIRHEIADLYRQRRFADADALAQSILDGANQGEHRRRQEQAAFALETRADIALQENRVEDAFGFLCRAADGFATIDPLQTADRRDKYRDHLYNHGLRYGGLGLSRAIDIMTPAIAAISVESQPERWGRYHNNLAIALDDQGTRTAGPEGAALLAQAVNAYRAALRVTTEDDQPLDWAATQNNLAIALGHQGIRTTGPEGAALLAQAVNAYRAALRVRTEADQPLDWAGTQNNIAVALDDQGSRTAGPEGAALLAQAVAAYRAALRVRTEADQPLGWAMTQNNLAVALKNQGTRTAGPEGAALLAQAVNAYRAALRVRTEADQPLNWAFTQENLAVTELTIADHGTTTDPRPHLDAALAHVEAALRVYDPVHTSYDYGTATELRDRIIARIEALPD